MVKEAEKFLENPTDAMLTDWLDNLRLQAHRHATKNAVLGSEICLGWGELEGVTTALTRRLREAGIEPGDRVAVCLERSPLTVAAFLAVLRLGGTYVPIDTQSTSNRIATMLECLPGALVTTPAIRTKLAEPGCPVIFAGTEKSNQNRHSLENAVPVPDGGPAYMLFTSGSTGDPNSVIVSRGALARYAAALQENLGISGQDVYLHTAPFSFSASIRQLVAPLTVGATLVIAGEDARHDPYCLLDLMARRRVTVWDTVPGLWRAVESLLAKAKSRNESSLLPETLRLIFLTGEPLSWALVSAWKRHVGNSVNIVNLYSQTETAGTVSMFPIPAGDVPETGIVPLGEPLAGIDLTVLDEDLNPVTAGREGELYVISNRLAEGCHVLDESMVSQFQGVIPLAGENRRVFGTGDLVQIRADGSLVPVGRRDHRVKIRGFRVDLQEIETEITNDPGVDIAVVMVEASTRLIAYIVPAAGVHPLPAEIQSRLRKNLPDHAVPGQVIVVDRLPTNANGKLDRAAIKRLRDTSPEASNDQRPIADQTENRLLRIWESCLGYKGALLTDNFFEKGGDSLTAVSLFLEIEDHFKTRLPPSTLLTAGTPGNLAALIRNTPSAVPDQSVLELRTEGHSPPLFLVHATWQQVSHFRQLVKLLEPGFPVYALEPFRNTAIAGRQLDIAQLVRRYANEIRNICPEGPFFLAGWSIGGFMAFNVAVELEARGDNPAGTIILDAASPSLRSLIRRKKIRGLAAFADYLRNLVIRQIRSFQLSPRDQWERIVWMIGEARQRFVSYLTNPARHESRMKIIDDIRKVADHYQPPPYSGNVVLFRSQQPAVDSSQDHDLGWGKYIQGSLDIVRLPGDHVTMVIEPRNMKLLAARISDIVKSPSVTTTPGHQGGKHPGQSMLDMFFLESKKLTGHEYIERRPWINVVTKDAIRNFADAICDDNPLWVDENHSRTASTGPSIAPPCFLIAARYPVLHGAPLDVPLISLLRDIEYSWERSIHEGESLHSSTEQGEVHEVIDPTGKRKICIDALTTYRNGHDQVLGRARSTVVRMTDQGSFKVNDWSVYKYSPEELERITDGIHSETRTGSRLLSEKEFRVGARLPSIVRGPLTIGDMVCWHSGIGPSYRPGPLGYKDTQKMPQFRVRNPITGWPIKYMLQHEDVNLAHQRGMPAPFDNGVMRFAWVSPLITNWMGDRGFLARLHVKINLPVFYGDTCWYSGEVTERSREADHWRVVIRLNGTNQYGAVTTSGSAEVLLPGGNQGNQPP